MKLAKNQYERSRSELVKVALKWEREFGVAPGITGALAEVDAAYLVGCDLLKQGRPGITAVTQGRDFDFCGRRYQIKANRPSGKPGSKVTLTGKAKNYDWDVLIWILYDEGYQVVEAWKWDVEAYRAAFHSQRYVRPKHIRMGKQIYPRRRHQQ